MKSTLIQKATFSLFLATGLAGAGVQLNFRQALNPLFFPSKLETKAIIDTVKSRDTLPKTEAKTSLSANEPVYYSDTLADFMRKTDSSLRSDRNNCNSIANQSHWTDTTAWDKCNGIAADTANKRDIVYNHYYPIILKNEFSEFVGGATFFPTVWKGARYAELWYNYDSTVHTVANSVSIGFSGLDRPGVNVGVWQDFVSSFEVKIGLYLPSSSAKSDSTKTAVEQVTAGGGIFNLSTDIPFFAYSGEYFRMTLEPSFMVSANVPKLGVSDTNINCWMKTGGDLSMSVFGKEKKIGGYLSVEMKYVYGFTQDFRTRLGFDNELGFGILALGGGIVVNKSFVISGAVAFGLEPQAEDVIGANNRFSLGFSVYR